MASPLISSSTVLAASLVVGVVPAQAQWLPEKSVRVLVPFAPGGAADVLARIVTQGITRTSNQAIVVENRPGGGTVPATEAVARSTPDGSTLLLMANSFVINPSLRANLPYHPLTSFEPLCSLAYAPTVIAVQRTAPYGTLGELLVASREPSSKITMAGVGPATSVHISIEMLKRASNASYVFVSFPGGTPAVTNLLGGHVTSVLANYSEVQANLGTELRALAIGADRRLAKHPEVPTLGEAGFAGIDATTWFGMVAPAKTPAAIASQMIGALEKSLADAEVMSKLDAVGLVTVGVCGEKFGGWLSRQFDMFAKAIKESAIKAE